MRNAQIRFCAFFRGKAREEILQNTQQMSARFSLVAFDKRQGSAFSALKLVQKAFPIDQRQVVLRRAGFAVVALQKPGIAAVPFLVGLDSFLDLSKRERGIINLPFPVRPSDS